MLPYSNIEHIDWECFSVHILAFDTSTSACTVALLSGEKIYRSHQIAPMQHTKLVLPAIKSLLNQAAISIDCLDAIAYGSGPGSFTGIRIASAIAQGLSFAKHIPLIKISSLAATAQTAAIELKYENVLVAVDARMGEVYWGAYRVQAGLIQTLVEPVRCLPNQVPQLDDDNWEACGDGWKTYAEELTTSLAFKPNKIDTNVLPNAAYMIALAKEKLLQQDFIAIDEAYPNYLS